MAASRIVVPYKTKAPIIEGGINFMRTVNQRLTLPQLPGCKGESKASNGLVVIKAVEGKSEMVEVKVKAE